MHGIGLSLLGLGIAVSAWAFYLRSIVKGTVAPRPIVEVGLFAIGTALGGIAVAADPSRVAPWILGTVTAGLGAGFLALYSIRRTPVGKLAVAVGDRLLPFEAVEASGAPFHSDSLAGQRVLLKFFRGHW